jgi:hypothetical protein
MAPCVTVETRRNLSDLLTLSVPRGTRTNNHSDNQGLNNFNPLRLHINRQENANHMVSISLKTTYSNSLCNMFTYILYCGILFEKFEEKRQEGKHQSIFIFLSILLDIFKSEMTVTPSISVMK